MFFTVGPPPTEAAVRAGVDMTVLLQTHATLSETVHATNVCSLVLAPWQIQLLERGGAHVESELVESIDDRQVYTRERRRLTGSTGS
jgi:hypothetical protein